MSFGVTYSIIAVLLLLAPLWSKTIYDIIDESFNKKERVIEWTVVSVFWPLVIVILILCIPIAIVIWCYKLRARYCRGKL